MKRKNSGRIGALILAAMFVFGGCGYVEPGPPQGLGLTMEQKEEDFLQYYNTILECYPSVDDEKEIFGTDFRGKKDYYLEKIRETEDDNDFFWTMYAISSELHNEYIYIEMPKWPKKTDKLIRSQYSFNNVDKIFENEILDEANVELRDFINENKRLDYKLYYRQFIDFEYFDGEYLKCSNPSELAHYPGHVLKKVNGMDVHEYVKNNISLLKMKYDFIHKHNYKEIIRFNSYDGDPVTLTMENPKGETVEISAFYNVNYEFTNIHGYEESVMPMYAYYDEEKDISLIKMDEFLSEGELAGYKNDLDKAMQAKNIIIDMRFNHSDDYVNAHKMFRYFHPEGTYEEIAMEIPKKSVELLNWPELPHVNATAERENTIDMTLKCAVTGGEDRGEKNFYYIIGPENKEAANEYAELVRRNTNAVFLGDNTNGSVSRVGYSGFTLKNSGLVCGIVPYKMTNDGKNISLTGVEPDYYVPFTLEDRTNQYKVGTDHGYLWSYKNRQLWDPVTLKALDLILGSNKKG